MSIIPASFLTSSDLSRLGNNLQPCTGIHRTSRRRRKQRRLISAVNRSLAATVNEQVISLHRPLLAAS